MWNFRKSEMLMQLKGHTQKARGLCWHQALPHILCTGSWDSSIKVWDVRDGKCLLTNKDHGADVYGLDSHPKRPFVLTVGPLPASDYPFTHKK